jgi:hypothetical protein
VLRTPQPSPSALPGISGARDEREGQLGTLLTGGLIALVALGMLGLFAMARDRRRRVSDPRIALLPPEARVVAAPSSQPRPRPRPDWEDYALENQPIGTVEYEPPPTRQEP